MAGLYRFVCVFLLSFGAAAQPADPFIRTSSVLCTSTPVNFTVSTDREMPVRSVTWTIRPAQPGFPVITADSTLSFSFLNAGSFTITSLIEFGSAPSFTSASRPFIITRSASAAFNASLLTQGYPNELILTNYSSNSLSTYWLFSDVAAPDSASNIVKSYNRPGSYTVTLVSVGRNGCNDASSYSVYIPDSSGITLPNVFTPNYDGVNDIYRPLARGINVMNARITNRDGVEITRWNTLNGFWDGRTTSGLDCDEGIYFITVEATGFNGEKFSKRSTITLLR